MIFPMMFQRFDDNPIVSDRVTQILSECSLVVLKSCREIKEAIVNDCQLVMLPFKGDQFLNSKLVADDLKAGIKVNRNDEDGFFEKEKLLEAVKAVMVEVDKELGKEIRENHMKWREFLFYREKSEQIHCRSG
ncbi:hypothetical protein RYX36_036730 [Vicia faba]